MNWLLKINKRRVVILLTLMAIGGSVCFGYFKIKKGRANRAATATVSTYDANLLLGSGDSGSPSTPYEAYLSETRKQVRFCLDIPPGEWSPPKFAGEFKDIGRLPFSADEIPAPAAKGAGDADKEPPLVRRAPFPYHRIFAMASDCCGTEFSDVYYTQTLLSRRYGLDVGSSFFPYSSVGCEGREIEEGSGGQLSLFWKAQKRPRVLPARIESEDIDVFPLFLCYYYRGWIDHIHTWSRDRAPVYSLIDKVAHSFASDSEASLALRVNGGVSVEVQGLEVSVDAPERVEWFELTLVDQNDLPHHIVYGRELGARPGWDLSGLPREKLRSVFLKLSEERNRKFLRTLGKETASGFPIKSATLTAKGEKGATVELLAVRAFDLTREMIQHQMAQMRQYNILPSASTWHMGIGSWAAFWPMPPLPTRVPTQSGATKEIAMERPALGLQPGTPAYQGDLLRDFGLDFLLTIMAVDCPPGRFGRLNAADGNAWYLFRSNTFGDPRIPALNASFDRFQNIGRVAASYLWMPPEFGDVSAVYCHHNIFDADAFTSCPTTKSNCGSADWLVTMMPPSVQMHQVKRLHPQTEQALAVLANAQYNLDGRRQYYQRVWVCPVSVQLRYLQVRDSLAEHAQLEGDTVRVTPWKDAVTGRVIPDADLPSQDLHGQTFYVPDSQAARVYVGERELRSLKRNPPDFTGRPSVTVIDTSTPTLVFDEVDFYEQTGRLAPEGASYFFRSKEAYVGQHALEVQVERPGTGRVRWEPFRLSSHETGFLRFAYRKTNPTSRMAVSWTLPDGTETVVTEADLQGRQGWRVSPAEGSEYHEVVVDFADLVGKAGAGTRVPRGEVRTIAFGLENAAPGDSIFFDRVEFLSARGVRPHRGNGLVVGGRLHPNHDGEVVILTLPDGRQLRTTTTRGGWFLFTGMPAEAVVEIAYEKDGVKYFPLRGRLMQVVRNDVECHIHATDVRSPFTPRPKGYVGRPVTDALLPKVAAPEEQFKKEFDSLHQPHSARFWAGIAGSKSCYMVEDYVNNYGRVDKDRRFDNPDGALRVVLLGDCWPEGLQTPIHQHVNVLLESMLRRRFGVPVEVIISASSSSSPASFSLWFEKYGSRFNPDLVLLFLNPIIMAHVEPSMLKEIVGWDKEHSSYKTYDFNKKGDLVGYPPDPHYIAFQSAAKLRPVVGTVPLAASHAVAGYDHPVLGRSFDLLRGILKEQYIDRQGGQPSRVGLIFGYDNFTPPYGTRFGGHAVADERWRGDVADLCEEMGLLALDLSAHVPKAAISEKMLWETDFHLTGTGHHVLARALAEELSQRPEFRALVERRKASLAREQTSRAR